MRFAYADEGGPGRGALTPDTIKFCNFELKSRFQNRVMYWNVGDLNLKWASRLSDLDFTQWQAGSFASIPSLVPCHTLTGRHYGG